MKSQAGGIDHASARSFAVENGVVGAGWGLNGSSEAEKVPDLCGDIDQYLRHAKIVFPNDRSLDPVAEIIGRRMQVGDFVWMYATHSGEFWCCRIEGPFEYRVGSDFDRHDLHMTRRCTWARAGAADAVPGVIRRAFAGQFGTVTAITTSAATAIEAAEIALGSSVKTTRGDFFAATTPEDLEDVVALYLQNAGWRIFPSTSKVSMASYEFILVHERTGKRAGVQVKSGNVAVLDQAIAEDFDVFFVFMAHPDARVVSPDKRLQRIDRGELERFARQNWALLPKRLQRRWPDPLQVNLDASQTTTR